MDQQVAYSHGQTRQNEHDPGNDGLHAEGEDQEKKSVLKKVKAKAKKIKDNLKLHGHGHDQHQEGHVPDDHDLDEEDDEDEEEIHGSSGYGDAAIKSAVPGHPGTLVGRSRDVDEDSSRTPQTKITDYQSGFVPGREERKNQLKLDVGRTGEVNAGQPGIQLEELEEDPQSPTGRRADSSNYQTKVTDPTGAGEEVGISSILRSFDKMNVHEREPGGQQNISSEPRGFSGVLPTGSHNQFSPELSPPELIGADQGIDKATSEVQEHPSDEVGQKPPSQGSYAEKISSATSALADKAISAKNVVASKLGYGQGREETHEGQEHHEKSGEQVKDKVVSVKDYFADKLRPGDEDRALSEVISEKLHRQKDDGANPGKPMGKVTESEEVRKRLGGLDESPILKVDESDERVPGKSAVDKLKGAVGSWFGKGEATNTQSDSDQSLGSTGTKSMERSTVGEETGERRLQESGN